MPVDKLNKNKLIKNLQLHALFLTTMYSKDPMGRSEKCF